MSNRMLKEKGVARWLGFLERSPWNRSWFCFLLSLFMVVMDYVTGPFILFPIFFIVPVMLAAWHSTFRLAATHAVGLSVSAGFYDFVWHTPWEIEIGILNSIMRCSVLLLVAWLTNRVAWQTRELKKEVLILEGVLPICNACKAIRDSSGKWMDLEEYVSGSTELRFAHVFCPACQEKHAVELACEKKKE